MKILKLYILTLLILSSCSLITNFDENKTNNTNNTNNGVCGDGVVDANEECDGVEFKGENCETTGHGTGALTCTTECKIDYSSCTGGELCGNGNIDAGEKCDGSDLNGATCVSRGYIGGVLACNAQCDYDVSACELSPDCGNGEINDGEECDGDNLNNQDCESQGYGGGTLGCSDTCTFDYFMCEPATTCGDGNLDNLEECDLGGDESFNTMCDGAMDNYPAGGFGQACMQCSWNRDLCNFNASFGGNISKKIVKSITDPGTQITYVLGVTNGDLSPGTGYSGSKDIFLASYDVMGIQQWIYHFGTYGDDIPFDMVIKNGVAYITGGSDGNFSTNYAATVHGSNHGSFDIFVLAYSLNSNGYSPDWVLVEGGIAYDQGKAIGIDASDKIFVAGESMSSDYVTDFQGVTDGFLISFNAGDFTTINRWFMKTDQTESVKALTISNNYVYVVGYSNGTFNGENGAGGTDIFLARYFNQSGTTLFRGIKQFGSVGSDMPTDIIAIPSTASPTGELIYISGKSNGDFNTGSGNLLASFDALVVEVSFNDQYSSSTIEAYYFQFGDPTVDDAANRLYVLNDSSGNPQELYVAGNTMGSIDGSVPGGNNTYQIYLTAMPFNVAQQYFDNATLFIQWPSNRNNPNNDGQVTGLSVVAAPFPEINNEMINVVFLTGNSGTNVDDLVITGITDIFFYRLMNPLQ